jgi:hypothetical protein
VARNVRHINNFSKRVFRYMPTRLLPPSVARATVVKVRSVACAMRCTLVPSIRSHLSVSETP